MGIYNALFTGSSGLSAFGEAVRVIGDNIANVNSLGFKSQNVVFSDVLSQTVGVTRSNIANQVGNGVRIGQITRDNQQGSIQNTTNPTDMAINGNGMFALRDPASGALSYTRAGAFFLDKDFNLIDGQGFVVQGWATDTTGSAIGNVTDISFANLAAQAQATTSVLSGVSLDSNATLLPTGTAFDPDNPATYHYKTQVNAYDSLGQNHAVSLYFTKTAANTWSWQAGVDGADLVGGTAGKQVIVGSSTSNYNVTNAALPAALPIGTQISASTTFDAPVTLNGIAVAAGQTVGAATGGSITLTAAATTTGINITAGNALTTPNANKLTFGTKGELLTEVGAGIVFPWSSASPGTISFDFGNAKTSDQQGVTGTGLNGTVQMAGSFATRQMTRDGFASGFLDKLETDSTGRIFGVFTNGQRRSIYQVALANFPNPSVLSHIGNNLQKETIASGSPVMEKPGNGGMGSITPFGLEQSNVDLAGEFVKLIVVQRGYEANSKTIMTTDQMLSSLMQIKR